MRTRLTKIFLLLALMLCAVPAVLASQQSQPVASLHNFSNENVIADRYIVVFNDGVASATVSDVATTTIAQFGGELHHTYTAALNGFAATLPAAAVDALQLNPAVDFIEADTTVAIDTTQSNAPWGLDRTDQADLPLDGNYNYTLDGTNVNAYVIDTGIRITHNEFGGRAVSGYNAVFDFNGTNDCNGHGTHVAGTVGGNTYGIAKNVTLYAVRVLGCLGTGSNSDVIAGVDWVTNNHVAPAVANMSLGGGNSTALDNAVNNSIDAGVNYVVAAGNDDTDACSSSPAVVNDALTVGSTANNDSRSSFSNKGTCVDIFAPGSSIISAGYTSDSSTSTLSGTSMAAPHVAGVVALYLQANPNASTATVFTALSNGSVSGRISDVGAGSPNLLLNTAFLGSGNPAPTATPAPTNTPVSTPTPPPPTATPTPGGNAPCTDCEMYSGTLTGTNDSDIQPNGSSFQSAGGTHIGYLEGPANADFDLQLQKVQGILWTTVASSTSNGSSEQVTYNGTSGTYRWRIVSYSGSGDYDFWMVRP